jgi:hypothetical protein
MSGKHILVADWHAPDFAIEQPLLEAAGITWCLPGWKPPPPPREEQIRQLLERIRQAQRIDGVLFVLAPLPAEVINALPASCRHMQRVGIGLDTIDLDAAKARCCCPCTGNSWRRNPRCLPASGMGDRRSRLSG